MLVCVLVLVDICNTLFDLIKEEDNREWIVEIQNKEGKEKVPLSAILIQITAAMQSGK